MSNQPAFDAERTEKRRFFRVLPNVDLKVELIKQTEIAESANPGPLEVGVIFLEMILELVKVGELEAALEAVVDLVVVPDVVDSSEGVLKVI